MAVAFEQTLRSLRHDTRRGDQLVLVVGISLLLLWGVVAVTVPLPRVVESTNGRIVSALEPTRIVAGTVEEIVAIEVHLGDEVKRGDLLVSFDQEALLLERASQLERVNKFEHQREELGRERGYLAEEHERRLELMARSLERVQAGVRETRASIEYAKFRLETYQSLRSERVIDALELQEAQALLKQREQRLIALEKEVEENTASREVTVKQWQATSARYRRLESELVGELGELRPQLEKLQREIDGLEIRAPHDGIVEGMAQMSLGQTLPLNAWLMTVSPPGEYQFEAGFLATEAAARIKPGASARIAFTALPWTEYGTLPARVARVGNEQRSELITVQLELDPDSELIQLAGHGLTGRAVVEVDRVTLLQRLLHLIARPGRS